MDRIEVNMEDGLAAAAAGAQADNYLGNTATVDRLVRDFLSSCVGINADFQEGTLEEDDAGEKLMELSVRYAAIFLGESKAYVAMPWNSPQRLEFYLRAMKPPHMEDHARAADAYFACHGTAAIMLAMRADKKELTEAEVQDELTVLRNSMVRALLGINTDGTNVR